MDGERVLETADPAASVDAKDRSLASFARLTIDNEGRPWLTYRKRIEWSVFGGAILTSGPVWSSLLAH